MDSGGGTHPQRDPVRFRPVGSLWRLWDLAREGDPRHGADAIVDAYGYTNAETDLNKYRTQ